MKAAKLKPGDKVKLTPDAHGLRISIEGSHAGQPTKVQTRNDQNSGEIHGS
jgi:hypothetical protein